MARKSNKVRLLQLLKHNYLLVSGIFLILIFSLWRYHQVRILSFNDAEVSANAQSGGVAPVYIKAYPVGVDIKVTPTQINEGVWMIPPSSVGFLVGSSGLGGGGNIIMYGHNSNQILGPIRWIKIGSKIELTGSDGKVYLYTVSELAEVEPSNLGYIQKTETEVLTLYTCSGFLDSKRFIVRAIPTSS